MDERNWRKVKVQMWLKFVYVYFFKDWVVCRVEKEYLFDEVFFKLLYF